MGVGNLWFFRTLVRRPAPELGKPYDFDRDGAVGARDASVRRASFGHRLMASPRSAVASQTAAAAAASPAPRRRWLYDALGT